MRCSSSVRSVRGNGITKGLLGYSPTAPHICSQSGVVSNSDVSNLMFLVLSIITLALTSGSLSRCSPFLEAIKPVCRPLCGTLVCSLLDAAAAMVQGAKFMFDSSEFSSNSVDLLSTHCLLGFMPHKLLFSLQL